MEKEKIKIIIELVEINENEDENVIDEYVVYSKFRFGLLLALALKQFIRETKYDSFTDWMEKFIDRALSKYLEKSTLDEFLPKGYFERFMDENGSGHKIESVPNKSPFIINEMGDDAWFLYRQARIYNFLLLGMKDEDLEVGFSEV